MKLEIDDIQKIGNAKIRKQLNEAYLMQNKSKENKNKYSNIKTTRIYKGKEVCFDSKKEALYFDELYKKLKAGLISQLAIQPKYEIIPTIKHEEKTLHKISYVADFYFIENGVEVVVDVKGFKTSVYQLKKRLFLMKYPDYKFIEAHEVN